MMMMMMMMMMMIIIIIIIIIIIKFRSVFIYLRANLTVKRPTIV
jgi:hypothetical protein